MKILRFVLFEFLFGLSFIRMVLVLKMMSNPKNLWDFVERSITTIIVLQTLIKEVQIRNSNFSTSVYRPLTLFLTFSDYCTFLNLYFCLAKTTMPAPLTNIATLITEYKTEVTCKFISNIF